MALRLPALAHAAALAVALFAAPPAMADSSVFLVNLTEQPLTVVPRNVAGGLAPSAWRGPTRVVAPGERAEVLRFSRTTDVRDGADYMFATDVLAGDTLVQLRQLMRGTLLRSRLAWSFAAPGIDHPWFDERGPQSATVPRGMGDKLVVTYGAYATGGDDDLEYVVARADDLPPPPVDNPDSLSVLAWNIQMLPEIPLIAGTQRAQSDRIWRLGRALSNGPAYDVLVVSEAFKDAYRDQLAGWIANRYPFRTKAVGRDGLVDQDGGVAIFSRWPIERVEEATFGSGCNGDDCRADKGVIYARINKAGRRVHVLGSHTQASYTRPPEPASVANRAAQFATIRRLVDVLGIPSTEPVLLAGDLNVDGASRHGEEYVRMLATLRAIEPVRAVTRVSSDPDANSMTGRNEGAKQMLDYVLPFTTHLMPTMAATRVLHARASTGYEKRIGDVRFHVELSDHFPVLGVFQFPPRALSACEADPTLPECRVQAPDEGCEVTANGLKVCR